MPALSNAVRHRRPLLVLIVAMAIALSCLASSRPARAEELRVHALAGGGHALGNPQAHEFGFGAMGTLALEVPFGRVLGVQLEAGAFVLSHANPPADVRLADHGAGESLQGLLGLRIHPFGASNLAGLWFDGNFGINRTGTLSRPAFDGHIGYDWRIKGAGRWDLGPFVGYTQVFQPTETLRPQDAHVLWVGIHVALGQRASRPDRDGDFVYDDEDACPDVPGIRTDDPKTNGCPREDRDKDSVFDDEDACPDVPGVRTSDPKTNGCPRADRDTDGVFDDEDACPDVPGVRTSDPKTNGCPPPTDQVHVEGDQILLDDIIHFDLGSPRVRRASWPIVKKVADFIIATPDIQEIDIEGHADESGTEEYNMYLSNERSKAVKALIEKFGVDASRLTTHAYGKTRPRAPGHAEDARRENRRVEFTITRSRPGNVTTTTPPTPP